MTTDPTTTEKRAYIQQLVDAIEARLRATPTKPADDPLYLTEFDRSGILGLVSVNGTYPTLRPDAACDIMALAATIGIRALPSEVHQLLRHVASIPQREARFADQQIRDERLCRCITSAAQHFQSFVLPDEIKNLLQRARQFLAVVTPAPRDGRRELPLWRRQTRPPGHSLRHKHRIHTSLKRRRWAYGLVAV